MSTRIKLTPQEIIDHYKESPIPDFAEAFGPLLSKIQYKPLKYDDFKKSNPVILPGEHNNQHKNENKSKDSNHKQYKHNNSPLPQPQPQPAIPPNIEALAQVQEEHKEITFGDIVQNNANKTEQVNTAPQQEVAAQQPTQQIQQNNQTPQFGFQPMNNPQFPPGFNPQQQIGFGFPQMQPPFGFQPQPIYDPNQFVFQPQMMPQVPMVFTFNPSPAPQTPQFQPQFVPQPNPTTESVQTAPEPKPEQPKVETQPVFQPQEKPQAPVPEISKIEQDELQNKPKAEETSKETEKIEVQPAKYTPPVDFSQLENEQKKIKESQKPEKKQTPKEDKISYQPQPYNPPVDFSQLENEQKKIKESQKSEKPKPKKEEVITYNPAPQQSPANDFGSIEEEMMVKRAIEESLKEQQRSKNKKQEQVIQYGAPVKFSGQSMDDIIREQEKQKPKVEKQEKISTGKRGKYQPFVAPKKEPLPPPVQPNVPSFDKLLNEAEADKNPIKVVQSKPTQPSKKSKKYQPFVPEEKPKQVFQTQSSPVTPSFSSLLESAEKSQQKTQQTTTTPKQTNNVVVGGKKKKKYVDYVEPERVITQPQRPKSNGPSFEELMAAEEKKNPQISQQQNSGGRKKGKKIVISENIITHHVDVYDPEAEEEYVAQRRKAVNQPIKTDFASLLEKEEKLSAKSNKQNVRLGYTATRTQATATSFEQLMAEEQQKAEQFEVAGFGLEQENQQFSTFEDKKSKKNKQQKRNIGANDFWDFDDVNEDDEIITEVKPQNKKKSNPYLAKISKETKQQKPKMSREAWMANKLSEHGVDEEEATEFAEILVTKNQTDMSDSLKSVIADPRVASNIASEFFKLYSFIK
ncbi:hypothetical protein TVAG_031010 [Trichomonas vaginalis G3]|uniref:Uncharacterized protein n=1 Tax=Trichomonas vaginalis (strain ATCC PRA-98 / G3) TaxID=412133 RepID=A2EYK9_TRIV3|nr:hypothetical protein TVAGG3_0585750 [Trichomonas vaginalis G3]EAY02285.1 hypothetical protein TVAG_031010 [Trichomonas vaginalis G3]KAI5522879.1 hypothetical protein TVAGG3_0585750 [Trichomonas vaginalis G3]|eukprot:XP_001314602.1 hypothetical protein [Trichomonas vaginalis G3]